MKKIDEVLRELEKIPRGLSERSGDPQTTPRLGGTPEKLRLHSAKRIGRPGGGRDQISSPNPIFRGDLDSQYPDWVEDEVFKRLDEEVAEKGLDALAWYVTFHSPGVLWGIHIPVSSLAYLEMRYLKPVRKSRFVKWQLAFKILLEHELFHFATDYVCAQWEILLKSAWRRPTSNPGVKHMMTSPQTALPFAASATGLLIKA